MDSENLLIVCRTCGRKVLMHNMRPDSNGENMVCNDCYKRGSANAPTQSISEKAAELQKPAKKISTEKMIKYLGTGCKYKFSRKTTQEVSKCPYCGKNSIVLDNALGADKILNEASNKKFEGW
jgi:DNA-directed RNA polymerase subunit RPC12/RpoP